MKHFLRLFPLVVLLPGLPVFAQQNAPAAAVAVREATRDFTLWELVLSAGWILVPLVLASILVVTLVIMNLLMLRRKNIVPPAYLDPAQTFLSAGDLSGLYNLSQKTPGAVPRVMERALEFAKDHPETDFQAVKEIAATEGQKQGSRMSQLNNYLQDVGAVAPMIGLLGTVIGILEAFGTIARDSSPGRTLFLAGGVSKALVATALGLIIGLVALAFFAYFRGRVNDLLSEMEGTATNLLEQIGIKLRQR
ncbi:MAG: MotA/TolQ/ExbB proton channel family protein [Verrucomicrobiae bacterium]|nr:MotA/TolQ/ExbB proton channel family protein [Verrucomicrobiae bacterium]